MSGVRPLACICVPVYNAAATIARTLDSLVRQSYSPVIIMVIDNASDDGTEAIVRHYAQLHPSIIYHRYLENIGAEGNFNRCISLSQGKYSCLYHSDDVYDRTIVEKQVAFLEENGKVGAVFTSAAIIDDHDRKVGNRAIPRCLLDRKPVVTGFNELLRVLLCHGNFLTTPSAMVRTEIYKEQIRSWNGGDYATSADLDVWLRIALAWDIGIINEKLIGYRQSPSSFTYRASRAETKREDMFLVLDSYLEKYRDKLKNIDFHNYRLLNLHSEVVRSLSHLINGRNRQTREMLRGIFALRNVFESLKSPVRARVLAAGYLIYLLSLLPLGQQGRGLLRRLRWGSS